MGIRGLTTYIKTHSKLYLDNVELHDTYLIIDGNNLMCQIYINPLSHCSSCFGGDYNIFAQACERFFSLLKRCKIQPFVILDGGHERRKLKTIKKRLKNKISLTRNISPIKDLNNFPILIMETFKNVMVKLNVEFALTLFEADDIIASLARHLKCPVLSNDSDFFIYDVQYIPFPTLTQNVIYDEENKYAFIKAKKYSIDVFLECFGGLDKEMLPLLATILGNDYINRSTFSNFFSQIKIPKGKKHQSNTQKIINGVLDWLRNETFESAIPKILKTLPKIEREIVEKKMNRVINGYNFIPNLKDFSSFSPLKIVENIDFFDETVSEEGGSNLDPFFKKRFLSGELPAYFMDIISLKSVYWSPQIEDFTQNFSQEISLPILQIILGILLKKNHTDEPNEHIKLYVRAQKDQMRSWEINPTFCIDNNTQLPKLSEIEFLDSSKKIQLIQEAFQQESEEIIDPKKFPSELALYFISINYWLKNAKEIKLSNIYSIILCIIYFQIVLKKFGKIKSHSHFMKIYGKRLEQRVEELSDSKNSDDNKISSKTIFEAINHVSMDDCILFVDKFIQFQNKDEVLLSRPHLYNHITLHKFAQFQSCLQMALHLNALLNFPLKDCAIEKLFSGTFIYNINEYIYIRGDVDQYLKQIFSSMPSLYEIFIFLRDSLIPSDSKLYSENVKPFIKKKRKRKNRSSFVIPTKETFNKFEALRISS